MINHQAKQPKRARSALPIRLPGWEAASSSLLLLSLGLCPGLAWQRI